MNFFERFRHNLETGKDYNYYIVNTDPNKIDPSRPHEYMVRTKNSKEDELKQFADKWGEILPPEYYIIRDMTPEEIEQYEKDAEEGERARLEALGPEWRMIEQGMNDYLAMHGEKKFKKMWNKLTSKDK